MQDFQDVSLCNCLLHCYVFFFFACFKYKQHFKPLFQHFHEAAYLADERQDLLTAINSFLDCSIVLPPSEVGGDELLHSIARFQREMLHKRHEQEVKLQAKEPKSPEDTGTRLSLIQNQKSEQISLLIIHNKCIELPFSFVLNVLSSSSSPET